MSTVLQSAFARWWATRRRHRAERDLRNALHDLNEHLLRDIGFQPRRSVGVPWP